MSELAIFGGPKAVTYKKTGKHRKWYRELAEKYEIGFLDAGEYAASSKMDGVHMDDENQRKLGEAVANYIQKQAVD